ncbi:hypothetical protein HDV04_003466 [Boothiomyces sp. JEL0838]|nr:hypothetical protein HDV04_003466 [Boothiomyces sp. JEL0838]
MTDKMDLGNLTSPLNLALILVIGYVVYDYFSSKSVKKDIPTNPHKKVIELRDFTPKELVDFNGTDGKPIYLAVCGKVFDVSSKPDFYGPGSMYENFSGRDASRGLAKNSFDPSVLTDVDLPIDKLDNLTAEEKNSLEEWFQFFSGKYTCIGQLVENK